MAPAGKVFQIKTLKTVFLPGESPPPPPLLPSSPQTGGQEGVVFSPSRREAGSLAPAFTFSQWLVSISIYSANALAALHPGLQGQQLLHKKCVFVTWLP